MIENMNRYDHIAEGLEKTGKQGSGQTASFIYLFVLKRYGNGKVGR
jgi:hypothetical protein